MYSSVVMSDFMAVIYFCNAKVFIWCFCTFVWMYLGSFIVIKRHVYGDSSAPETNAGKNLERKRGFRKVR